VTLKSPFRIEALFACQFIALLANCLIERELRHAMSRDGISELALYHEQRACTAPTAALIFEHFTDVQRHQLTRDGQHIQTFDPQLSALQHQLLELLGMPASAYTSSPVH
jgi:quinol monooxygenase YgiN